MKKRGLVFIIFIWIFLSVNASDIGLIEDSMWQGNLTGTTSFNIVVFGDIDKDSDLDMISAGCTEIMTYCTSSTHDKIKVWINNGTTFNENLNWEQNLSNASGNLALGDIDNDGDLDLISSSTYTKIYLNNGTAFQENSTWQDYVTGETGAAGSIAIGDIDNDGDLDLIFSDMSDATPLDSSKVIWLNNGTTFVNSSTWGGNILEDNARVSTGLFDFDNDGDLDLNIAGMFSSRTYENNGTGFFRNVNWGAGGGDEASVAWGDVDNDGDFDQIVTGYSSSLLLNEIGTLGWFTDNSSEWGIGGAYAFGFAMFGDYDNNGYLDLLLSGVSGGNSVIVIKENNGTYLEEDLTAETNLLGSRDNSVLWADIDNDDDLDLVIIADQKVYISNASLTNPNEAPTPPTSFSSSYNNGEIKLGWINGSDNETVSTGLYYNLMVGNFSSNNHSIISGVYGGAGDATRGGTAFGYYGNMMQRKNFTLKVERLSPSTNYTWYVQTIDTGLKAGAWSSMQSFLTPDDMTRPNVTLNSPVNYFNSSSYIFTINATVFDNMNLTNVSLWGNWTGSFIINSTNSSGINNTDYIFVVNLTCYSDGNYIWRIQAGDNFTNAEISETRTFTLDTTTPDISITFPSNNTNSSDTNLGVNYSVSDLSLASCWYSNDSFAGNISLANCGNITSVNWSEGQHNVTIWVNDSVGNVNYSIVSFTIDSVKPDLSIVYPSNNTNSTDSSLDINYTASDTYLESCWYSNDSFAGNISLANCGNITSVNWSEGQHNVTIWVNDSAGNVNSSLVIFTVDTEYPIIDLVSPANASTWTSSSTVTFSYNVSDVGIANCSLIIGNSTNLTDTSISEDETQAFSKSLSNGNYNWSINCTDYVGYTNNSDTYSLVVSYTPSSSSSSGGGGGGGGIITSFWTKTETVSDTDFTNGVSKELTVKQRIRVSVNSESHYVGVVEVTETTATINISSDHVSLTLSIGEDAKVNVNSDNWYDIYVKLNSIIDSKVNLTIQNIHEEIPMGAGAVEIAGGQNNETVSDEIGEEIEKEKNWIYWFIVGTGVLIGSALVVYFIIKKRYKK